MEIKLSSVVLSASLFLPTCGFITRCLPHISHIAKLQCLRDETFGPFVTRLLSWEVLFFFKKKDGKQDLMIQRMKGIVGDWNRLVQEGSYLECTLVVLG